MRSLCESLKARDYADFRQKPILPSRDLAKPSATGQRAVYCPFARTHRPRPYGRIVVHLRTRGRPCASCRYAPRPAEKPVALSCALTMGVGYEPDLRSRGVLRSAAALGGRLVCNARLPIWARGASWNFAMLPSFSNLETRGAIERTLFVVNGKAELTAAIDGIVPLRSLAGAKVRRSVSSPERRSKRISAPTRSNSMRCRGRPSRTLSEMSLTEKFQIVQWAAYLSHSYSGLELQIRSDGPIAIGPRRTGSRRARPHAYARVIRLQRPARHVRSRYPGVLHGPGQWKCRPIQRAGKRACVTRCLHRKA